MDTIKASLPASNEVGTCKKHGEFEIRAINLGFKTTLLDKCPVCARDAAQDEENRRQEKNRAEKQAKIEARLEQAGIPPLLRGRTFKNYVADTEGQKRAMKTFGLFAKHFDEHLKTGTILLAVGKMGTGKSHLACATANYLMARGRTAYFTSTSRLFTKIRATWSKGSELSEEQLLRQLEKIDLVVVDEVGVQRGTEDESRVLYEFVESRRLHCKPTILLSNYDGSKIKDFLDERLVDRMSESGVFLMFDWESHRRQSRDVGGLDNLGAAA
jgi:DNA replication protein DnaC